MAKLELTFQETTDNQWERIFINQEGMVGLRLPTCWLHEFVEALEKANTSEKLYFWENYFVLNNKANIQVGISTKDAPLLQLDVGQCAKLIAHFRSAYPALV